MEPIISTIIKALQESSPVILPLLATLLTLIITQRFNLKTLERQLGHDRLSANESRDFAARESRYEVRRGALVDFIARAQSELDSIEEFERSSSGMAPGDIGIEYSWTELDTRYANLALVATERVSDLAFAYRRAILNCFDGVHGSWDDAVTKRNSLLAEGRALLDPYTANPELTQRHPKSDIDVSSTHVDPTN